MSADIVLWGAVLGFTYLAAIAVYFELVSAERCRVPSTSHGFGRHARPRQARTRHRRRGIAEP
ncbi:hypothetical protein [Mesorhizobium sp. ES1-4]|uniref:hypothetical protein n=1 Tax=Mesorhizobium sp. ES1-4 TaxID=2876627 RepID=UPI001CCC5493|nr:hypothetical protein [Mesorhizobium sp. ES1-4]MBZ9798488.1 hypothetical protein [Mesorhizobium sp. ES1-4]